MKAFISFTRTGQNYCRIYQILEEQLSARQRKLLITITLVLLSLSVSVLYGMHHLLLLYDLKDNDWQTIFITSCRTYDAPHYLAQLKEIYEGHYRMSNVFLAEHKETIRPFWPILPFYLIGGLGKILHIKVQHLAVIMDFTLPPIIFLLSYALLVTVGKRRKTAIGGACILGLYPHLPQASVLREGVTALGRTVTSWNLTELLPALWNAHAYHNGFARPINPQLTVTFLLAALLFFVRYLRTLRRQDLGLAIVFGIILSYSYVYFSSYLYTFWGAFILLGVVLKHRGYITSALIALGVTLMCALPFWLSTFGFTDDALRQVTIMTRTHAPILTPEVLLALAIGLGVGLLMARGWVRQLPGHFMLALLVSAVIAVNQRVITGLEIQSWHYHIHVLPQVTLLAITLLWGEFLHTHSVPSWEPTISLRTFLLAGGSGALIISSVSATGVAAAYLSTDGTLSPISNTLLMWTRVMMGGTGLFFLFSGIWRIWRSKPYIALRMGTIICGIAFLPMLAGVGAVQYHLYYGDLKPRLGFLQALAPALHWLNMHTEPESVILTGLNYHAEHTIMPIYTHNNLYTAPLMSCYPVPSQLELQDRVYNTLYLMNITSRKDFDRLISEEHRQFGVTFEEYQQKLKNDLYAELTTYQVDYVFYGPREQVSFQIDLRHYPFLREVYHDNAVTIYAVIH